MSPPRFRPKDFIYHNEDDLLLDKLYEEGWGKALHTDGSYPDTKRLHAEFSSKRERATPEVRSVKQTIARAIGITVAAAALITLSTTKNDTGERGASHPERRSPAERRIRELFQPIPVRSDADPEDPSAQLSRDLEACAPHCTVPTFLALLRLAAQGEYTEHSILAFRNDFPEFHTALLTIAHMVADAEDPKEADAQLSLALGRLHRELPDYSKRFITLEYVMSRKDSIKTSLLHVKDVQERHAQQNLAIAQEHPPRPRE